MTERSSYPLFLRLDQKAVTVVGGGLVALEKAEGLIEAGACVRVVAPVVVPRLAAIASEVRTRPFDASDVEGAWLVIAAAPGDVNRVVREACDQRRVFVIAVDDVANCTATSAARVRRSGLTIAIASEGRTPALVALLRRAIEALLPDDVDRWCEVAERARADWKKHNIPMSTRRPLLLQALNALYTHQGSI